MGQYAATVSNRLQAQARSSSVREQSHLYTSGQTATSSNTDKTKGHAHESAKGSDDHMDGEKKEKEKEEISDTLMVGTHQTMCCVFP